MANCLDNLENDLLAEDDENLDGPERYIDKNVSVERLRGRGFLQYEDGELTEEFGRTMPVPDVYLELEDDDAEDEDDEWDDEDDSEDTTDGEADDSEDVIDDDDEDGSEDESDDEDDPEDWEDDEEEDSDDDEDMGPSIADYIPDDCWVKRMPAMLPDMEAYFYLVLEVTDGVIEDISVYAEVVEQPFGGMFFLPGYEMKKNHIIAEEYSWPDVCDQEMRQLLYGGYLKEGFSFIGKKLPEKMIEEGGNGGDNTNYTYACQSGYRCAYMHMGIDTTEDGIIRKFRYTTYQSTGSAYGDMFSRPHCIRDREDEALDMLLYLMDQYEPEERKRVLGI